MTFTIRPLALAAFCAAATSLALAQPASSSMASSADRSFVMKAGAGGAAEVALGKMATQKAMRDDVKQFGQQMVDDHTKANDELKSVAGGKGMTPPDAPTPAQQKDADKLSKLSGASFDRAYLNQMVLDHQRTIAVFQTESRSGRDADLKSFATKTLPTLQEHLTMVKGLQTKGGAMNRADNEAPGAAAPRR